MQANDLFEMIGTVFINNSSLKTLSLDNVGMRGYVLYVVTIACVV